MPIGSGYIYLIGSIGLIEFSHRQLTCGGVKTEKLIVIGGRDFVRGVLLHDVINFETSELASLPACSSDLLKSGGEIDCEIGDLVSIGLED